jgi:hypothetical protein
VSAVKTKDHHVTIYVRLLNEGTEITRPTEAVALPNGLFKLLPTPDYDPKDEVWEFPPSSVVSGEFQEWSSGEILVAIKAKH